MRHVIHNLIAFDEMEVRAAHALMNHTQRALAQSGGEGDSGRVLEEGPAQVAGNRCLRTEEPTWQEQVDREIEDAEARLQHRICKYDRVLEVLTVNG